MASSGCDLCELLPEGVTEVAFVDAVVRQYKAGKLFSLIGPVCLFLNPQASPPAYDYARALKVTTVNPAHVYSRAAKAYTHVQSRTAGQSSDQSCVFSGEAGSGKTFCFNASVCHVLHTIEDGPRLSGLPQRCLAAIHVLRAFGTAKANGNPNSTRCALLAQLVVSADGLQGLTTGCYLLEKTRLFTADPSEGAFLPFYFATRLLTPEQRERFGMGPDASFALLANMDQNLLDSPAFDGPANEWRRNLETVGLSADDTLFVLRMLCALLHLSNITFTEADGEVAVKDSPSSQALGTLLELNCSELFERLAQPGYELEAMDAAESNLHALMAELYSTLTSWLVVRLNGLTQVDSSGAGELSTLSFLDLFGFEKRDKNSFEQLCINVANERLHQVSISCICEGPQQVFEEEHLDYERVPLDDNSFVIDLLLGDQGLLQVIDAECGGPKGTDETLLARTFDTLGENPLLVREQEAGHFGILHYAGKVTYDVATFVKKNRYPGLRNLPRLLSKSRCPELQGLFTVADKLPIGRRTTALRKSRRQKGQVAVTTVTAFTRSLNALLSEFTGRNLWVTRCILTNRDGSHRVDEFVLRDQLRANLLVETAKIFKRGFPVSFPCSELLSLLNLPQSDNPRTRCRELLQDLDDDDYAVGKSLLFFSPKGEVDLYLAFPALQKRRRASSFAVWMQFRGEDEEDDETAEDERRAKKGKQAQRAINSSRASVRKLQDHVQTQRENVYLVAARKAMAKIQVAEDHLACSSPGKPVVADQGMITKRSRTLYEIEYRLQALASAVEPMRAMDVSSRVKDRLFTMQGRHLHRFYAPAMEAFDKATAPIEIVLPPRSGRKKLEDEEWFHGVLARAGAEERLRNRQYGTFLIRTSETREGYALSVKLEVLAKHYIIDTSEGGGVFVVGKSMEFDNVQDLVAYHRTRIVSSKGCELSYPCPRPVAEVASAAPEAAPAAAPAPPMAAAGELYVDLLSTGVNEDALREVQELVDEKMEKISTLKRPADRRTSVQLGVVREQSDSCDDEDDYSTASDMILRAPTHTRPPVGLASKTASLPKGATLSMARQSSAPELTRTKSVSDSMRSKKISTSKIKTLSEDALQDFMSELAVEIDREKRIFEAAERLYEMAAGGKKDRKKQRKSVDASQKTLQALEQQLKVCTDQLAKKMSRS